jgi:hypothetical protein
LTSLVFFVPPAALPAAPMVDDVVPVGLVDVPPVPNVEADVPPTAALPPVPPVAAEPAVPVDAPPLPTVEALCAKLIVLTLATSKLAASAVFTETDMMFSLPFISDVGRALTVAGRNRRR